MNATLGAPVPAIIWDALTNVLEASTLRLAKDIAQSLGTTHIPLMDAIRAQKIRPYVVELADDPRDIDMRCDYECQRPDAPLYIQACAQPVFWGGSEATSKRCPQHLYSKPQSLPALARLHPFNSSEESFYISEDGTLYDTEYQARGHRSATGKMSLFEVESE